VFGNSKLSSRLNIGQRFGRLVVIGKAEQGKWKCQCDCGNTSVVFTGNLTKRNTRSCGCLRRERSASTRRIHGKSYAPVHWVWRTMIQRCTNPKNEKFAQYGGRGITVCDRWRRFSNFLADMDEPPPGDFSIARKDNHKGYSPDNCEWATRTKQALVQSSRQIQSFKALVH
jgi:hypothetical protein